jgi:hypothetical protein
MEIWLTELGYSWTGAAVPIKPSSVVETFSPEDGKIFNYQNTVFYSEFQMMHKVQKPSNCKHVTVEFL